MTPKKVHPIFKHGCRSSISWFWPDSISPDLLPVLIFEIILVQVVAIVTVIPSKDVHMVFVNYRWMWVSRWWSRLCIGRFHQFPGVALNVKFVEIVHAVKTIVPAKNVDTLGVNNCGVSISCTWRIRRPIWRKFFPLVCLKVEAVEVIATIGTIVATKNVEMIVKGDTCVQRARTRRLTSSI